MADSPPSNRIGRSARLGGLVAGQSARWAGTRAANLVRSPEEADAATGERAAALARELVKQLGQLRGAAMKVGQVLSTIDFTAIPESEREDFKATLAALRDDVPPLPYKKVRKLLEEELGGRVADHFDSFEEEAFAAASIGQVHRAITLDGDAVAVKIQYPGVAEAVESDLRNLSLLLPLVKRLAPGLDVKALYGELRERIAEELDYELEAQNHRAVERAFRGHPFAHVPKVHTDLSSRRVLVTDLLSGRRFEEVKALDEAERDRFGEIVFRFYFSLLSRLRRPAGAISFPFSPSPPPPPGAASAAPPTPPPPCCSTPAASVSSTSASCGRSIPSPSGAGGRPPARSWPTPPPPFTPSWPSWAT